MNLEIEAKFMIESKDSIRARLVAAAFACTRPEFLMRRYTFNLTELNPDPHKWARVRDEGDKATMTFKRVHDARDINGTEEIDFTVSSFESAVAFLQKLGFSDWVYQENLREIWINGDIEITINEWPALAPFIEIEGPSEDSVRKASANLGLDYGKAIFGGVGALYAEHTAFSYEEIVNVKELTFAAFRQSRPEKLEGGR